MSKLETKKLSSKYYTWEWERNAYPFYVYIFTRQWRYNKFFKPVYVLFVLKNKKVNCYLETASLNQAARDILSKAEKEAFFVDNFKRYIYKTGIELHNFCDKLERINLGKKDVKELQELLAQSFKIYSHHTSGVGLIRNINRLMQKKLLALYKSKKIVSTLFSTDKKSFFLKEHEQLLKIANLIKKKKLGQKEIDKLLDKHTKKYFYLAFGYYDCNIFTKNDFEKKLRKIMHKNESVNNFQNELNIKKQERDSLILKIKPNIQIKRLIELGSTCTFFKDFIRGNLNRLHYNIYTLFKELGKKVGKDWAEIASILPDKNGFVDVKKGNIISGQAIIYSDKDGIKVITNKKAEQLIKIIDKNFKVKYTTNIIKGMNANPGLARGRVRIIFEPKKINEKGFILVASMTTPDLMPLIKRSKAIITDEGGLTCHAAIISRELGVPCIVGTKIATKVLKDGDLVEVDANKGIVKILKRAK